MEKDMFQIFLDQFEDEKKMTKKQKSILQAAIDLFADKGYHATSTAEIAKKAEVAEGTVFRHFKTKKGILLSLLAPFVIKMASPILLKDVREILDTDTDTTDEVMKNIMKNRIEFVKKNLDKAKIIFQEAQVQPEIREAFANYIARNALGSIESFVQKRMQRGELREMPVETVARCFASMMFGFVFLNLFLLADDSNKPDLNQQLDSMVDIIMNGIKK